jgi:SAM-dependent methyltransferase
MSGLVNWQHAAKEDLEAWFKGTLPTEKRRDAAAELRDAWNASSKDPDTFYRSEDANSYLFDLTAWHMSMDVVCWLERVKMVIQSKLSRGDTVLDYGAGIGTYSLMMANMGIKVFACEVNPLLRDYIHWRAKRRDLCDLIMVVEEPEPIYHDMILCLDTIEHLRNPEDFPRLARRHLAPGGWLLATWTFHQSNGMHPMHHDERRLRPFMDQLNAWFTGPLDHEWPALFRGKTI